MVMSLVWWPHYLDTDLSVVMTVSCRKFSRCSPHSNVELCFFFLHHGYYTLPHRPSPPICNPWLRNHLMQWVLDIITVLLGGAGYNSTCTWPTYPFVTRYRCHLVSQPMWDGTKTNSHLFSSLGELIGFSSSRLPSSHRNLWKLFPYHHRCLRSVWTCI